MQSHFHRIELLPDDPILGLPKLFNDDPHPRKVNLGIGIYKTEEGSSYLFESVRAAEKVLFEAAAPLDYLPIEGDSLFLKQMIALNLGKADEKTFAFQTVGGTGSLSLAAEFLLHFVSKTIAISNPSWLNHVPLFKRAGFNISLYPYFHAYKIPFEQTVAALKALPQSSIVLFQTACHNPTGIDFSKEEWQTLLELVKAKNFLPLFDNAYQGLGTSLEEDIWPQKLFYENGVEMVISTGCSKNFGLYGERVGALIFCIKETAERPAIMSQLRKIIRSRYSSPPLQGAKIVAEILNRPALKKMWEEDLARIDQRIQNMRQSLAKGLNNEAFNAGKGFFSLLDIDEKTVLKLRKEKGIYMPLNGRINMAALTPTNMDYVIAALKTL